MFTVDKYVNAHLINAGGSGSFFRQLPHPVDCSFLAVTGERRADPSPVLDLGVGVGECARALHHANRVGPRSALREVTATGLARSNSSRLPAGARTLALYYWAQQTLPLSLTGVCADLVEKSNGLEGGRLTG